jgi:hypothetical protein
LALLLVLLLSLGAVRRRSAGRRLDEVVDAQIRVVNPPPIRRSVGLLPGAALIDILLGLIAMLDGLVGAADWVAEDYSGIVAVAHGRQGS